MEPTNTGDLVEQAAALERACRWEEAEIRYSDAFDRAAREGTPIAMVDSLRGLARVYASGDRYEEADELAELSRAVAQAHGLDREAARALNLSGFLRHSRGDLDGAEALYEAALGEARRVGDHHAIGFLCQNLGVIANIRGDHREARLLYLESIGAALASEDELNISMVYNNLGMVCTDLGEHLEAEVYFDRGIEIAARVGARGQLARMLANRAEPLLATGETRRARLSLEEAEEIATELGARVTLADVARFRGRAARIENDAGRAERYLQQALTLASEADLALGRAEALQDLALLHWDQGRQAEAYAEANESLNAFRGIGAARDAASLSLLIRQWEGHP